MSKNGRDATDGLEALESESLNSERVRRMKRLMKDMYKEEFESQRLRLPPIKSRALIVTVSFLSIVIFGVTTLYNFNRFVTLEERVLSSHGHIEDALQRRLNLVQNLVNLTLNQAALEQEVYRHVADVRKQIGQGGEARAAEGPEGSAADLESGLAGHDNTNFLKQMLGMTGNVSSGALANLLAVVEQYPNITASVTYQQLMDKLVEIENRITLRRDEYNEEVRIYNTLISSFPWYILAKVTGFDRYDYFTARDSRADPVLRVPQVDNDTFDRLLPVFDGKAPEVRKVPKVVTPHPLEGQKPSNDKRAP
ncbi:LemA family protein [Magnetococcus marinus MC-1]|uniref:LemA family protein n=1 Tax=Magnetococcus marinus (strain ATCC BAA-1437 / JCM 17883 / MC-1) TaxID=156889 RepID=A0L9V9_MAGMM|nr:magnetosome protein MamQ [Magnetococcus marinus]ABK44752.1 LemA family protein [Magnetococcus marinus MC-1]